MNIKLYLGDIGFAVCAILVVFCVAIMAKLLGEDDYKGNVYLPGAFWFYVGYVVFGLCMLFLSCFIFFRCRIA